MDYVLTEVTLQLTMDGFVYRDEIAPAMWKGREDDNETRDGRKEQDVMDRGENQESRGVESAEVALLLASLPGDALLDGSDTRAAGADDAHGSSFGMIYSGRRC